jgi:hypothetical protein
MMLVGNAHGSGACPTVAVAHEVAATRCLPAWSSSRGVPARALGSRVLHSFEMIGKTGKTAYSLFFGTRHITGLKVMKEAMWSIDPATGVQFSDRLAERR